jgi:hypothetical protein
MPQSLCWSPPRETESRQTLALAQVLLVDALGKHAHLLTWTSSDTGPLPGRYPAGKLPSRPADLATVDEARLQTWKHMLRPWFQSLAVTFRCRLRLGIFSDSRR